MTDNFVILENAEKSLEKLASELVESAVSAQLSILTWHFINNSSTWKYSCCLFYLISNDLQEVYLNSQENSEILSINPLNSIGGNSIASHNLPVGIPSKREDGISRILGRN